MRSTCENANVSIPNHNPNDMSQEVSTVGQNLVWVHRGDPCCPHPSKGTFVTKKSTLQPFVAMKQVDGCY